jgi:putative tricarboxylic transport membrane protein
VRDKVAGLLLGAVALGYVFAARGFETGFIADPIGPKAFPYAIGMLALVASGALLVRPKAPPRPALDAPARLRALVLAASLALYAVVLDRMGFVLATTLEMAVLVGLFRGSLWKGLLGGLAVSAGFFLVFAYGLSVPLPLGSWFGGR